MEKMLKETYSNCSCKQNAQKRIDKRMKNGMMDLTNEYKEMNK